MVFGCTLHTKLCCEILAHTVNGAVRFFHMGVLDVLFIQNSAVRYI
jgi:hypothetical protein